MDNMMRVEKAEKQIQDANHTSLSLKVVLSRLLSADRKMPSQAWSLTKE